MDPYLPSLEEFIKYLIVVAPLADFERLEDVVIVEEVPLTFKMGGPQKATMAQRMRVPALLERCRKISVPTLSALDTLERKFEHEGYTQRRIKSSIGVNPTAAQLIDAVDASQLTSKGNVGDVELIAGDEHVLDAAGRQVFASDIVHGEKYFCPQCETKTSRPAEEGMDWSYWGAVR